MMSELRPVPDPSGLVPGGLPRWRTAALMRILLRQASLHTAETLREQGYGDLRPVHLLVLERLYQSGVRATELAGTVNLTKQATGQILDRMEALGYVERVPDPLDGRAKLLRLTERGRRAADALRVLADETDARWAEILGDNRYRQLRAAIGALITASQP